MLWSSAAPHFDSDIWGIVYVNPFSRPSLLFSLPQSKMLFFTKIERHSGYVSSKRAKLTYHGWRCGEEGLFKTVPNTSHVLVTTDLDFTSSTSARKMMQYLGMFVSPKSSTRAGMCALPESVDKALPPLMPHRRNFHVQKKETIRKTSLP
jgi:hypothetical protein